MRNFQPSSPSKYELAYPVLDAIYPPNQQFRQLYVTGTFNGDILKGLRTDLFDGSPMPLPPIHVHAFLLPEDDYYDCGIDPEHRSIDIIGVEHTAFAPSPVVANSHNLQLIASAFTLDPLRHTPAKNYDLVTVNSAIIPIYEEAKAQPIRVSSAQLVLASLRLLLVRESRVYN